MRHRRQNGLAVQLDRLHARAFAEQPERRGFLKQRRNLPADMLVSARSGCKRAAIGIEHKEEAAGGVRHCADHAVEPRLGFPSERLFDRRQVRRQACVRRRQGHRGQLLRPDQQAVVIVADVHVSRRRDHQQKADDQHRDQALEKGLGTDQAFIGRLRKQFCVARHSSGNSRLRTGLASMIRPFGRR